MNLRHSTHTYSRDESGDFSIPSLGYGLYQGEPDRHFDCDDSSYAFPEGLLYPERPIDYQVFTYEGYQPVLSFGDALKLLESNGHKENGHIVIGIGAFDDKGLETVCLIILWPEL